MSSLPKASLKQKNCYIDYNTDIKGTFLNEHDWELFTSHHRSSVLILCNMLLGTASEPVLQVCCAYGLKIKIRFNHPLCYSLLLSRILFHSSVISNHRGSNFNQEDYRGICLKGHTLSCLQFTHLW